MCDDAPERLQRKYGGAVTASLYDESIGASLVDFFQFDHRGNKRKGVVFIEL